MDAADCKEACTWAGIDRYCDYHPIPLVRPHTIPDGAVREFVRVYKLKDTMG